MRVVVGKDPAAIQQAATLAAQDPISTFGSWLLSLVILAYFTGVQLNQCYWYQNRYRRDSWWLKLLVLFALACSMLHWIASGAIVWRWWVLRFGDWSVVVQMHWAEALLPAFNQLGLVTAQLWFVYRCFSLTGRSWKVLFILLASTLTSLGALFAYGVGYYHDPYYAKVLYAWATVSTSLTFASSFIMSGVITSQLAASKGELTIVGHKTTGIRRQIAIVIESLAPATIAALVNLITFFTHPHSAILRMLVEVLTSRLFVYSFMHNLNSRDFRRGRLAHHTKNRRGGTGATIVFAPMDQTRTYTIAELRAAESDFSGDSSTTSAINSRLQHLYIGTELDTIIFEGVEGDEPPDWTKDPSIVESIIGD